MCCHPINSVAEPRYPTRCHSPMAWNACSWIATGACRSRRRRSCSSPRPTTPSCRSCARRPPNWARARRDSTPPSDPDFCRSATGAACFVIPWWAAAAAGVDTAIDLGRRTGEPALAAQPLAFRTLLAAYRDDPAYESHLTEIQGVIAGSPLGILQELIKDVVRWAQAAREAAQGSPAFHHLDQMTHHITRGMAAIDRLEAALHAGRDDAVAHDIAELGRFATATGSPWAAAAAAHGRALLCDGAEAQRHFRTALDHHASSPRRFDRARTELAYGEFLRRTRRRVDARPHLRAALQVLSDLGAASWAHRAAQELRASGETARRREPSAASELTHQELEVARLVARGLSNREAAARLFVSQRTVEFHLR